MNPTTVPPAASISSPDIDQAVRIGLRLVEERCLEWTRAPVAFLQDGSHRMLAAGGKRFRPTLCLLSYLANGGRPFEANVLDSAALVELLHTATLVHDDILDDADQRRGQPTAHRRYGSSRALLLGDHMLGAALSPLPRLPPELQRSFVHASRLLAEGEAFELELTRAGSTTLEDYFVVIAKKTAVLFEATAHAGAWCARPDPVTAEAFAEFGFQAGIAFQLMDDLLDVEGVTEVTGKPTHWDLGRGVPNAAVLATLESELRGRPAAVTLPRGRDDAIEQLLQRIAEEGGDERVRRLARMYGTRALESLNRVPSSEARDLLRGHVEASLVRLK